MRMVIVREQNKKKTVQHRRWIYIENNYFDYLCVARFASKRFSFFECGVCYYSILFYFVHFEYVWNVLSPKKKLTIRTILVHKLLFDGRPKVGTQTRVHKHLLIYILLSWCDQLLCSREVITCGKSYSGNSSSSSEIVAIFANDKKAEPCQITRRKQLHLNYIIFCWTFCRWSDTCIFLASIWTVNFRILELSFFSVHDFTCFRLNTL